MLNTFKNLVIFGCCMSGMACSTLPESELTQSTRIDQLIVQDTRSIACSTLPVTASTYHIRNSQDLQKVSGLSNKSVLGKDKNQTSQQAISTLLITKDLLVINMGQKPTGGYTLKPLSKNIQFEGSEAKLKVLWQAPAKGMLVTQVLTPFCLVLEIPEIRYKTLYIIDQHSRILFSIKGTI